jgi:hypothetical protein
MNKLLNKEFYQINNGGVWVYCSAKAFDDLTGNTINAMLADFIRNWQSHGHDIKGLYQIIDQKLVIVAIDGDKQQATGCSIDALTKVMNAFKEKLGVDFLNRFNIPVFKGGTIKVYNPETIGNALDSGEITLDDPMVNLAVHNLEMLKSKFLIPIRESWVMRQLEFS